MIMPAKLTCRRNKGLLAGTTLIEMTIAMALITIVLGSIYSFLITGNNSFRIGTGVLQTQQASMTLMDRMTATMKECKLIAINDCATAISVQVPIEGDNGSVLDGNYRIRWGAIDEDGNKHLGGWMQYEFLGGKVLSESTLGFDFNEDDDTGDLFNKGAMQVSVYDSSGTQRSKQTVSQPIILQTHPAPGGDIDADGYADPIFIRVDSAGNPDVTGKNIRIILFSVWIDYGKKAYIRKVETAVTLRNPQD